VDVVLKEIITGKKLFTVLRKNFLKGPTKELGANTNDTLMMHQLVHLFEIHFIDPNQTRP
jgi:hypothetical protein